MSHDCVICKLVSCDIVMRAKKKMICFCDIKCVRHFNKTIILPCESIVLIRTDINALVSLMGY